VTQLIFEPPGLVSRRTHPEFPTGNPPQSLHAGAFCLIVQRQFQFHEISVSILTEATGPCWRAMLQQRATEI
jgi:hypothetical protein